MYLNTKLNSVYKIYRTVLTNLEVWLHLLTITGKLKSQVSKSDASSDFECKLYNIYYIEQVTGLLSESKMILFTIWSHFFNILPKVWNYLNRFALIKKMEGNTRNEKKSKKELKKTQEMKERKPGILPGNL